MDKYVITVTGGGSEIFNRLLSKGGASQWFLEGHIPYSYESLTDYLGFKPEKACSDRSARQMAMVAYRRALALGASRNDAVGIGCTCSLAKAAGETERPDRPHHFYIAKHANYDTTCLSFLLKKHKPRSKEEYMVSEILDRFIHNEMLAYDEINSAGDYYNISDVVHNQIRYKVLASNNSIVPSNAVIFPGSFNPFHKGHNDVVNWCNNHLYTKPYLELCVTNVDKPPLDYIDIAERIESIKSFNPLISGIIVSNTPRFFEKSWTYLSPKFIIGVDTFNRLLDKKYYKSLIEMEQAVDHFIVNQTKFYVLDRKGFKVDNNSIEKWGLDRQTVLVPLKQYEDILGVSSTEVRSKQNEKNS